MEGTVAKKVMEGDNYKMIEFISVCAALQLDVLHLLCMRSIYF